MIINSLDKQFVLADNGNIMWQKDLTDPREGEAIATIAKGEHILRPECALIESEIFEGQDKDAVQKFVQEWLHRHIQSVLEPLFKLQDDDIADGAPQKIAQKIYDDLGIVPREELQELISEMDEEGRNTLRSKKIRFGPIIVYLPELNKPAGVDMQALLLSLWQGKELPAQKPAEGIVSFSVEGKDINPDYYRAIGYPVFGPRSIRVDMLDRVICSVYDGAEKGKFKAQHQMAEWLGCNIADLYAVLEAMGHRKIYDPADNVVDEAVEKPLEKPLEKPVEKEQIAETASEPELVKPEPVKQENVKPELATFVLKSNSKPKTNTNSNSNIGAAADTKNNKFKDNKFSSSKNNKKFKKKKTAPKPQGQRVYKAEAQENPEDNPFAILQQLKSAKKE